MIYLDNNATTRLASEVLDAMLPFLKDGFGNPSSYHRMGAQARQACDEARARAAKALGVQKEREIIFTSNATESNNTAVCSALKGFPDRKKIVITAVEHSSILNLCKALEQEGYEPIQVGVSSSGDLCWEEFERALSEKPAVVSVMWVNNETGVLFPIERIVREVKSRGLLIHVDAVQAAGKIQIDLARVSIDYLSLSAHKFHGPKGIGALYVREGAPFSPFIIGGGQELGRRGGTEYVAGIVGFGKAIELACGQLDKIKFQMADLRDLLEGELLEAIPLSFINGKEALRVSNTSNMTFPGISAESFLIRLSEAGILASSGSACSTGALEPSHVLQAMGHSRELASSSIRFSLSRYTTHQEILEAVETIAKIASELQDFARKS